jgi:hypothetical protein
MTTCRVCGAELSPELEWCPQCLTPIAEHAAAAAATTPPSPGAVSTGASGEGVYSKPPTSVLRGGPNSFGIVGKLIFTAIAIAGGYALYRTARVIVDFYGHGGLALVWLFLGIYVVVVILVLWNVWRPAAVDPETRVYPHNPDDDSGSSSGDERDTGRL